MYKLDGNISLLGGKSGRGIRVGDKNETLTCRRNGGGREGVHVTEGRFVQEMQQKREKKRGEAERGLRKSVDC